ncbi:refilin B [Latimeria chalumnae]|uniref:refilin B n=1 Tax=Latimeria chalumnae TaxID=7897 RepID=UPI0003C1617F|nr:PREDICTED: filamin-interacting protein FAM101B [Latimeria chalumnae]|eukprot:XP_005987500.1 PREDICTED: filamin-interacting protein FAM101B [Latimeria chalumnae]
MVGRLNLQDVPDPLDMKKGERVLDSPDSGLPPSPSPSSWLLSPVSNERRLSNALLEQESQGQTSTHLLSPNLLNSHNAFKLCPLSFGEGVELEPLPPKKIWYTSLVKYDSDKHFIDNVLLPVGLGISSCSETIICVPESTWRSYKSEVIFKPQNKPLRFQSTTIIYPKHAKAVYTTTLDYNCRKSTRWFLASVELEAAEYNRNDFLLQEC